MRLLLCVSTVLFFGAIAVRAPADSRKPLHLQIHTEKVLNRIDSSLALGGGLDGMEAGGCAKVYRPEVISMMLSAGLGPISYRLRTDLGIEAWHWSDEGHWSDPEHQQGYWISEGSPNSKILRSNGFRLPHRGTSGDQANNDGYSRLTDGDAESYWKSNPYLDHYFTNEDNHNHPQEVIVDLEKVYAINAIQIAWGTLYATDFDVFYWQGESKGAVEYNAKGSWKLFPEGHFVGAPRSDSPMRLTGVPVKTRFVKLLFYKGAEGEPKNPDKDVRAHLGVTIRELYIGLEKKNQSFVDFVKHGKTSATQTKTFALSTDPWHSAMDRDEGTEQPGLDLIGESPLTRERPWLMAVGVLYDTPENAVAAIRYLRARGYPISGVELGEEPDGQYVEAEDYGALYIQFAKALHEYDPTLKLGGPSFQTVFSDVSGWPEPHRDTIWLERFLRYLDTHGHREDFSFLSFEWYHNDNLCDPVVPQLIESHESMEQVFEQFKKIGIPKGFPIYMTEYGYTPYAGEVEVTFAAALFNADSIGTFLKRGGTQAFFYGYEPSGVFSGERSCKTYGALMLLLSDWDYNIKEPVAAYYETKMLTEDWIGSEPGEREILNADFTDSTGKSEKMVSAYASRDARGEISILLVNRDPTHGYSILLLNQKGEQLFKEIKETQYSVLQYKWIAAKENGHTAKNFPPRKEYTRIDSETPIYLPPTSLVVVRPQLRGQ